MPKPIFNIDSDHLIRLKKEIRNHAGFDIQSKNDCAYLSTFIQKKTGEYLSESTLYRFFLSKKNHQCYKNTLDKLSRFCEYDTWNEFCKNAEYSYDPFFTGLNTDQTIKSSLIQSCLLHQEFKSLEHFFESIPDKLDIKYRRKIGLDLFDGLRKNQNSNELFYKIFSKSDFVRRLLFEELADPDFRLKDADLLYKWYLKHTENKNQIEMLQDFIFGNAMLFRYHFKNRDSRKWNAVGNMLFENSDFNLKHLSDIHVFPQARWFTNRLLYSHINKSSDYDLYEFELIEYCKKAAITFDTEGKNIVLYNTLDVLLELDKNKMIHEKVLPLFKQERKNDKIKKEDILSIMKKIEPNGLKRLIA